MGTRSLTRLLPDAAVTGMADNSSPVPGRASDGYRMDRWARLSLTVTVLATAVIVIAALTAGSASPRFVDVTVTPGDTLWSIASTSAPDRDPRAVIHEIQELNQISGDVLPVGVVLRVPASTQ